MLDKILKLLPFAGGLLVSLGILKVSIYYHYFNIPVLSYLSISEVLMLFLNDINIVIIVILIGIMHFFITEEIYDKIGEVNLDYIILQFKVYYVIFFGIGTIVFISLLSFNIVEIAIWNIYLTVFFAIQFIGLLFTKKTVNNDTNIVEANIKPKKIVLFICLIIVISVIPLLALKDIRKLDENNGKIILHLNDKSTITNSKSNYYLGKAGEYHFIYNTKKEKSIILKESNVIKIEKFNYLK